MFSQYWTTTSPNSGDRYCLLIQGPSPAYNKIVVSVTCVLRNWHSVGWCVSRKYSVWHLVRSPRVCYIIVLAGGLIPIGGSQKRTEWLWQIDRKVAYYEMKRSAFRLIASRGSSYSLDPKCAVSYEVREQELGIKNVSSWRNRRVHWSAEISHCLPKKSGKLLNLLAVYGR